MRIRQQQIFLLLATSVFLTSTLSLLIYNKRKETLKETIYNQLESISMAKELRIKGIIHSRYKIITFPANNSRIIENLINYNKTPNLIYQKEILRSLIRYTTYIPGFTNIHVLNLQGRIVSSSDTSLINQNWSKHESFIVSRQGKKFLDGFHYNNGVLHLFLSSPIYSNQKLIGVIIVEGDASDILSITMDYGGLGKTGETLVAKKNHDKIIFLTPLRQDSISTLQRWVDPNKETAISRLLNEKKDLLIETIDFRGVKVLMSARYIPESAWGLVTKINYEEAMSPIYELRNILLLFNAGAILMAFIIAYFAGTQFVKPIEELIESTNKIKLGDLSKRAKVTTRNEVGLLATSFNQMADRLQQKAEHMENYAYIISHDLKAPLASIEGLAGIIKEEYQNKPLDAKGKEILEMMDLKIKTMKRLIDDVLKTAKEESKIVEAVNMYQLTQEILENLNPPPHYHIFIQQNLPIVRYHKLSLMQILQNLIGNSIKYMNKEHPLIKVGSLEFEKYYQICISDNGSGIPKEKLSGIFRMFETAHDHENGDSYGIGLSIVKQLVEEHGGKVWVKSIEGKETHFYFTIPK